MENLLDRELYRKIKRMDKKEMEAVLREFYNMGVQSVAGAGNIDLDELRIDIGKIKGIGDNRLEEIMDVIEMHLTLG